MTSLANFYTALAEITAAVLSIVAASATAFYLLGEERKGKYADEIELTAGKIPDAIFELRGAFQPISPYVGGNFAEIYSRAYPAHTRLQLAAQAIGDALFKTAALTDALKEAGV